MAFARPSLKRVRALFFTFVGLLYIASWAGVPLRPILFELSAPELPTEVTGRDGVLDVVVSASDGDKGPIASARVRAFAILDGKAHAAGDVKADEGGRATLRDLPLAEHWVVAEAEGRARASQMVVVAAGASRLDLALGPEHFLDVQVKAEGGGPLPGAEIEIRATDPFPVGARADVDGKVRVGRLGEAPFTVTVRAAGYQETTKRRVPEGEPLVVTMQKQGALVVRVLGEDGAPAPSARVLVASPSLWPARVTETTADGTVHIAGLDAGTYSLRAVLGSRASPIEVGVLLGKGEGKEIELRLAPGVMITAHVVDASADEDVRGASVTLAEGGLSPFPLEGVTDKAGRVVLGPIARGSATLSARAEGYVPRPAVAIDESPPAEVKIGLLRGGVLVGKVTDSRGYAVDGATLRVVGTDIEGMPIDEDPQRMFFREAHFSAVLKGPSPLVPAGELGVMPGPIPPIPHGPSLALPVSSAGATAARTVSGDPWVTSRDGTFRASPVTPGRVRVLVQHPQYVEAMSDVVVLAPDKEARVDVVLLRGGTLEGRVVDVKGRGVSGAHVTILATRGTLERVTRTGSDGSFAFASVPDALTVLVSRDEDVTSIAARVEVSVAENAKKTIDITIPEPREPLLVHVSGDRGADVDAAQISAVSIDPNEAVRVTAFSDARGDAKLAGGKGLALRVEVHAPGRASRIVMTTPETTKLDVVLAAAERITGEVTGRRRDAIEGAEVTLHTETGVRHARTGKDGAFTIDGVTPGPARLRVRAAGFAAEQRDIVVEDRGGRRAMELARVELAEEAIVEGVVVDGRGEPIAGARVGKDAVPTYLPTAAKPSGMAVTDARGRFKLTGLAEGVIVLEAYAADVGRARATDVRARAGRTTDGVKLVLARGEPGSKEPLATGGVAITLGETSAGLEGPEVVIVAVSEGSEAERAGLATGDVVLEVSGSHVATIQDARARLSGPVHDDVVVKLRRSARVLTLRIAREQVRR